MINLLSIIRGEWYMDGAVPWRIKEARAGQQGCYLDPSCHQGLGGMCVCSWSHCDLLDLVGSTDCYLVMNDVQSMC